MRRTAVLMMLGLLLGMGTAIAADETYGKDIKVWIDGAEQRLDAAPMVISGRLLVPMRGIFEKLGATVVWEGLSETVTAQAEQRIRLTVGDTTALVGDGMVTLDTAPMISLGRVYVPLRFVSEALGAYVNWNGLERTVTIQTARGGPPAEEPPAAEPGKGQPVTVSLYEWGITVDPKQVGAGKVTFNVSNTGTMSHALAIVGQKLQTSTLPAGDNASLTLDLAPGTYILYCPVKGHRDQGMETTFVVTQ